MQGSFFLFHLQRVLYEVGSLALLREARFIVCVGERGGSTHTKHQVQVAGTLKLLGDVGWKIENLKLKNPFQISLKT